MSFGYIAKADDGSVVIDNSLPVLVEADRYTLTADGSSGGYFHFLGGPAAPAIPGEITMFRLRVGQWVSTMAVGLYLPPALGRLSSNQSEIDVVVMALPQYLPAPTGFGRVLFKDGVRVWDSTRATAAIASGITIPFAEMTPLLTWTADLEGDAIHFLGGYTSFDFSSRRTDGFAARLLSPGTIRLEHRTVWPGSFTSGGVAEVGLSAITARIT